MKPTYTAIRHQMDESKDILTMRKLIALAVVAIASQVVSASAGEAVASSKEVAAPPPPPPLSYFRSNEFSLGLFGSYGLGFENNKGGIGGQPWGGGIVGP